MKCQILQGWQGTDDTNFESAVTAAEEKVRLYMLLTLYWGQVKMVQAMFCRGLLICCMLVLQWKWALHCPLLLTSAHCSNSCPTMLAEHNWCPGWAGPARAGQGRSAVPFAVRAFLFSVPAFHLELMFHPAAITAGVKSQPGVGSSCSIFWMRKPPCSPPCK